MRFVSLTDGSLCGHSQPNRAEWTAQQITEAFPWDEAPSYLIRDRHRTYGHVFRDRVAAMGIKEIPTRLGHRGRMVMLNE